MYSFFLLCYDAANVTYVKKLNTHPNTAERKRRDELCGLEGEGVKFEQEIVQIHQEDQLTGV